MSGSGTKSVRIDPNVIQKMAMAPSLAKSSFGGSSKASTFGDVMGIMAPVAAEVGYAVNPNSAAVLHAAFSATGQAANSMGAVPGYGYQGGFQTAGYQGAAGVLSDLPGAMGYASHGTGMDAYGAGGSGGGIPGMDGSSQADLINQMNTNNLQLLELQAVMQNNMQQWTTKSNVLKSVHDAKMSMIQHFAVRG